VQKRFVIVGTAQSYTMAPWNDPDVVLAGLNDAYRLGFPRADEWHDHHPMNKFWIPPNEHKIFAHDVPFGHYARPKEYLAWLASLSIPLYLNPDYLTQYPAAAGWSHAKPLPVAEIEDAYGRYACSSPQMMMAHAMLRGFKHIEIYGIHLATQAEYVRQRPGMEYLIGRFLGPGKHRLTVRKGLRYYESQDGCLVLPEASPVLQASHRYALEPTPERVLEPIQAELTACQMAYGQAMTKLRTLPWWQRKKPLDDELVRLEACLHDTQDEAGRLQLQLACAPGGAR
jgi:hypothetical protein